MRAVVVVVAAVALGGLLAGCDGTEAGRSAEAGDPTAGQTSTAPTPTSTATPTATPSPRRSWRDSRWRFYTDDRRLRTSPWFAGRHRVMIPFGCTPAPYYDPDPACPDGQGRHHGIDVAMPCGTPLRAGRPARVLDSDNLGSAYGANPVLLRVGRYDVVVGHTRRVFVQPGDRLAAGQRFALAGDSGAPDGCHLHFEVRPAGRGYLDAVDPGQLLALS